MNSTVGGSVVRLETSLLVNRSTAAWIDDSRLDLDVYEAGALSLQELLHTFAPRPAQRVIFNVRTGAVEILPRLLPQRDDIRPDRTMDCRSPAGGLVSTPLPDGSVRFFSGPAGREREGRGKDGDQYNDLDCKLVDDTNWIESWRAEGWITTPLLAAHGWLLRKAIDPDHSVFKWMWLRADGEVFSLGRHVLERSSSVVFAPWRGAYGFAHNGFYDHIPFNDAECWSVHWFSPEGRGDLAKQCIPFDGSPFAARIGQLARIVTATRAGLIVSVHGLFREDLRVRDDERGLYLIDWNGAVSPIARGFIRILNATRAVSPDGCRIAAEQSARRSLGFSDDVKTGGPRLVVIDLCS